MILLGSKDAKRQNNDNNSCAKRQYEETNDAESGDGDSKGMRSGQRQKAESEDDKGNDKENDVDDEKEEDELRKRVEDFIEKVNKGWKAELLRSSHLA
ncbi:hypothetical protein TIFTF001_010128 [Ficus carica]|uniref:Uncharacterized protein n=1 Tax=Ficus carica TaxID=3494 RepID=A0AA88D355_FICCA|nr:hypothetical protein TIFTF001_010128 [Ficus carica]